MTAPLRVVRSADPEPLVDPRVPRYRFAFSVVVTLIGVIIALSIASLAGWIR